MQSSSNEISWLLRKNSIWKTFGALLIEEKMKIKQKKGAMLNPNEILSCFIVAASFIFSNEKLYFIISSKFPTATLLSFFSLLSFHLCFTINLFVFTLRTSHSPEIRYNYVRDTLLRENLLWRPIEPINFYCNCAYSKFAMSKSKNKISFCLL